MSTHFTDACFSALFLVSDREVSCVLSSLTQLFQNVGKSELHFLCLPSCHSTHAEYNKVESLKTPLLTKARGAHT